MDETLITIIKDKKPVEALLGFAEELSATLISRERVGRAVISQLETDEERELFMTAYMTAMVDYLTARVSGRLQEPEFGVGS